MLKVSSNFKVNKVKVFPGHKLFDAMKQRCKISPLIQRKQIHSSLNPV